VPSYLRFSSPFRGVSLLPTLVLFSAGLALLLRTWYNVRRQDHEAFWPAPSGLSTGEGEWPVLLHLRGLPFQLWICGLWAFSVALQIALPGRIVRPLMEDEWVTHVVIAAGGILFIASCSLFAQLVRGWLELQSVLDDLDSSTYRAAFEEAGRLMNWNAMRALGRGLKTQRSSQRGRELLKAQSSWAGSAVPGFGASLEALESLAAEAPRGRRSHSDFEKWKFRARVARQMTACGDALDAAFEKTPEAAALHLDEVDLFRALRAVYFIREGFIVVRHLLIGALGWVAWRMIAAFL